MILHNFTFQPPKVTLVSIKYVDTPYNAGKP